MHHQPLAHLRSLPPVTAQRTWFTRLFDSVIYIGGILGPLFTVPQLVSIIELKSSAGVSLISWGSYLVGAIAWLAYGIAHKERPIMVSYGIWVAIDAAIVVAIIVYR